MSYPEPTRFDKVGHLVFRATAPLEPRVEGEKTYPGLCFCERNEAHCPPDDDTDGKVRA